MTLITSYIKPKFRIIASDARCTGPGNIPSVCQKIFANKKIAIGIYGKLSPNNRERLKDFLDKNPNIQTNEIWGSIESDITDIKLGDIDLDFTSSGITHFVTIPRFGCPEIICFEQGKVPFRDKLTSYKKVYQKVLPEELFFSEQLKENDDVDFEYQEKLEKHFHDSIKETGFNSESPTKETLISLFKVFYSKVYWDSELSKESIGGNKIFMAYSINDSEWEQVESDPVPYDEWKNEKLEKDLGKMFGDL